MFLCHRGVSEYFPENTIGSIVDAIHNPQFTGVEIDIQLTKDNKWIIYHDDNLLRLNCINKKVKDVNFKEINKIKWKGKEFYVNLLEEMADITYFNFTADIEIKPLFKETSLEAKEDLKKILKKFRFKKFLSSFDHDWYDWCIENTTTKFACLTEEKIPEKGDFWIVDHKLLEKIDLIDIMERNVTLGSYGSKTDDSDDTSPLKYKIVDNKKRKVVYVDGTFDLVHPGHIEFFKKAKSHGDYLIVGVLEDTCVESYKRIPILTLEERTKMLKNLKIVDKVISPAPFYNSKFGDLTKEFIEKNEIDYVAYAGDIGSWDTHYKAAIDMNMMVNFPYGKDNLSTSEIINRVVKRKFN